jgi:hypothetical protein
MKYRFITVGAVLLTWLVIFILGITDNAFAFLVPGAVLAFFQIGEKRYLRKLSGK